MFWRLELIFGHARRHRHGHRTPFRVWLFINGTGILLPPNERAYIMSQLHVGQILTLSIQAVDAAGNLVQAAFDEKPVWSNSNPAAATDAPSGDGSTDVVTPIQDAVGQVTTLGVSVRIGGTVFTASVDETIVAGDVAGIRIVETFSPAPPA